jgi:hypothetical protein
MHAKPVQDLAGGKSILFGLLHPPITSRKNNNKYFVFAMFSKFYYAKRRFSSHHNVGTCRKY